MIKTKVVQQGKHSKGMKTLVTSLDKLQKAAVDIGYFNGEMHNGSEMSLATLMTLLEYGSNDGKIPARFPFSQVSASHSPKKEVKVRTMLKAELRHALKTGTTDRILDRLGKHYVHSIRQIFGDTSRLISNAKLTQKLKGKDSPLIDEGELLSKLTYRKLK